jgi:archaemetzincin
MSGRTGPDPVALLLAWCLVVVGCNQTPPARGEPLRPLPALSARAERSAVISNPTPVESVSSADLPKDAGQPRYHAFDFDPELFEKKRLPQSGEWLERFHERGQPYDSYVAGLPTRPTAQRTLIALQPLGPFSKDQREVLETLREAEAIFFDVPVVVMNDLPLPTKGQRRRGSGWTQHHTRVILDSVLAPRLPRSAICSLGITMADLYPEPSWNFVFGQASLDERVGVYSLVRFFPAFTGEADTDAARRKALRRSIHILAHETGHMFSLEHCTEYECLMNGSNSLEEMDRQVDVLCPVCLRKLQWNLKFDVRARYERLRDFYRGHGLDELAEWMDRRLVRLADGTK